ncbi:MAG: cupredoxin family protein [Pseudomonadota bacterium]|nr:cupredoxin family protein [Pseudomonadota bacterium]
MTLSFFKTCALYSFAALSISTAALAGGTHAGGHDHGHDAEETAIGKPGKAASVKRTVTVEMSDDMRFSPDTIPVKQGETVRFVVKNMGKVKHEFSLGTQKELLEHYELMKKFPDMEHDEPSKVSLAPGQQGEIVWQFTKAGAVDFACLHPGHYDAGMKGQVKVGKK